MRLCLVTDAWLPQVNGVVRTLEILKDQLGAVGHNVHFLTPNGFRSFPCPSYPEIRLALATPIGIARAIDALNPDAIHIATEGPLGHLARRYCRRRRYPFTTSFHTLFPEYLHARWQLPVGWSYAFLRRFHGAAACTMVATPSIEANLRRHGFRHIARWSRGVDTAVFHPRSKDFLPYPRPISLYVGRIAVEKSIEDFLALDFPGTKVIVGDGPQKEEMQRKYPEAVFVGVKRGEELARHYAAADVFVFPSRTDTFGLVMLEALASGVPVAAYPVPGPLDVIDGSGAGVLAANLRDAIEGALAIDPAHCRQHAEAYSWANSARQFIGNVVPVR